MKTSLMKKIAVGVLAAGVSAVSYAVPVTFFDTVPGGQSSFTNTVVGAGASVSTYTLSGLSGSNSWDLGDYTITTTGGGNAPIYGPSQNNSSGDMIGISPTASNPELSGITFTFDNPVNALGFEVGDWATCCLPSSLFIAFDGGSTQLVGTANNYSDNPTVANGGGFGDDTIFIGAIDDTDTFTTVSFYGDGYGEFLTAGGTIYTASVDIGSVDPNPVAEPSSLAMLGIGLAGLVLVRRKK